MKKGSNSKKYPKISLVIPCFNEENYISRLLDSILNQDYKGKIEVLVIDGNSEDKTLDILKIYSQKHKNIKVFNNPKRKTPFALNIGLDKTTGDYFCIIGAHSKIPKDWVRLNYETIVDKPDNVAGVGGRMEVKLADNKFSRVSNEVTNTFLGGGISAHRYSKKEMYANTVMFGLYRSEIAKKFSFDNEFIIGQDAEFNMQLIKAGYKLYYNPKIKCTYFARTNIKKFIKQMYTYGIARTKLMKKHKLLSYPAILSGLFSVYFVTLPIMLFLSWIFSLPLALYLGLIVGVSITKGNIFYRIFTYFSIHFFFGLGLVRGIIR